MTTKQEIIDYIERNIPHEFYDEKLAIKNAIKGLKPTVKPLLWHKHPDGLNEYLSDIGYFIIEEHNSGFSVFWDCEEMPEANSLEEAQAYCQSCHDMQVLEILKLMNL